MNPNKRHRDAILRFSRPCILSSLAASFLVTHSGMAQEDAEDGVSDSDARGTDLAQQLQNPVADLVSVPVQFNFADGVGPDEAVRTIVNLQPVVPFELNDDWNLISRWIMPYVSQPSLAPGLAPSSGIGDIVFSAFFSPQHSDGLIWGAGPVLSLPATNDPVLGTGKWSMGPTFVALKQSGPWTYGFLANYLVSVGSATNEPRPDVGSGLVQPFLSYSRADGVSYSISSESSYNSKAGSGNKWTVPINFSVSKITRFGPFPFSIGGGLGWYADAPDGGPDWQLRANFSHWADHEKALTFTCFTRSVLPQRVIWCLGTGRPLACERGYSGKSYRDHAGIHPAR